MKAEQRGGLVTNQITPARLATAAESNFFEIRLRSSDSGWLEST